LAKSILYESIKEAKREIEQSSLLDDIKNKNADKNLTSLSMHLMAKKHIEENNYALAAKELSQIIETNSNFDNIPFVLYDMATLNYFKLNNQAVGEKYYNELIAKFTDEEITKSALVITGKTKPVA
jgi:hypothetical protein